MRNDPKVIMNGLEDYPYGIWGRIRRSIAMHQTWKMIALHVWRTSFPLEAMR